MYCLIHEQECFIGFKTTRLLPKNLDLQDGKKWEEINKRILQKFEKMNKIEN